MGRVGLVGAERAGRFAWVAAAAEAVAAAAGEGEAVWMDWDV